MHHCFALLGTCFRFGILGLSSKVRKTGQSSVFLLGRSGSGTGSGSGSPPATGGKMSRVEGLKFDSFEEFWPFYMNEHAKPITRKLHFVGTLSSHVLVLIALIFDWRLLILAPIVGYGLAWYSHFFIEMNRPASFKWPLWSFIADNKMVYLFLTGRMSRELRYLEKRPLYKYS